MSCRWKGRKYGGEGGFKGMSKITRRTSGLHFRCAAHLDIGALEIKDTCFMVKINSLSIPVRNMMLKPTPAPPS